MQIEGNSTCQNEQLMRELIVCTQGLNEVQTKLAEKTEESKAYENEMKSMMTTFQRTLDINNRKIEELEAKCEENSIKGIIVKQLTNFVYCIDQPGFLPGTLITECLLLGIFLYLQFYILGNICTYACETKSMKLNFTRLESGGQGDLKCGCM